MGGVPGGPLGRGPWWHQCETNSGCNKEVTSPNTCYGDFGTH